VDIILREATRGQLADANLCNLLGFFRSFGRNPRTEFREEEGITRWRTNIANPWFRGVISARPPRGNEHIFVQDMIAYFDSRGVDMFSWWIEPGARGLGWEEILVEEGLHHDENTPGMAVELAQLRSDLSTPAGLKIQPVKETSGLRTWCSVFVRGYGVPEELEDPLYDLMEGIGLGLPLRHYLGVLDEQPVGAALLFYSAGVAGIYCIATLPHMRGHGIGAALTLTPLQEAQALGYHYGILQSSDQGYTLYRRLGFERLFDVGHFFWKKKD
jgi:ribosomal protein S18 acetylase RimI-like enzyme